MSQTSVVWRGALVVLAITLLGFLGTTAIAGKPKPPPPPPPARVYDLVVLADLPSPNVKALDAEGRIVGSYFTAAYQQRPFAVFPVDTDNDGEPDCWWRDEAPPGGVSDGVNDLLIEIGTLPGATASQSAYVTDVNDRGQVVGASQGDFDPDHPNMSRAFLWEDLDQDWVADDAEKLMLGALVKGNPSNAYGINNLGYVVGQSAARGFLLIPLDVDEDGAPDCWFYGEGTPDPAMGANLLMLDLGAMADFTPHRINDDGVILGDGGRILVPEDTDGDGAPDCWWKDVDADGVNDLVTTLPGLASGAVVASKDLNALGEVAGSSWPSSRTAAPHAVVWDDAGTIYDLGIPDSGTKAVAWGLDTNGRVVGQVSWVTRKSTTTHAYLWADGKATRLIDLVTNYTDVDAVLEARQINDRDQILGTAVRNGGTSCVVLLLPTSN